MHRLLSVLFLAVLLHAALAAEAKLNLNRATAAQLVAVGLTESQARQVLSHREQSGPLLQVEELQVVPQIDKATFEKVRDKVTVDE